MVISYDIPWVGIQILEYSSGNSICDYQPRYYIKCNCGTLKCERIMAKVYFTRPQSDLPFISTLFTSVDEYTYSTLDASIKCRGLGYGGVARIWGIEMIIRPDMIINIIRRSF
jgi:hypothetical protein